ncbi:MAG: hypothetical protein JWL73_1853 [Actinomycetia bacterium]|nr:hypothetical protein [Actinomycetes bacterium]
MIEVTVDPDPSPADVVPVIRVRGLDPDASSTVVIDLTDAAGNAWRSSTEMRTDADGAIDTSTLADPSRPWWDMAFAEPKLLPVAFRAPADSLTATVTVAAHGGRGSCTSSRVWAGSRRIWTSSGTGYRLTVVFPHGDGPFPAVLVVPGVDGPDAAHPLAGLLAAHGYVAGIVTYIEADLLPDALEEVPVEAFARAIADLAARPEVAADRVAIHASSVATGGVLLMLATANAPDVLAVVAVAPTSVVWQARPSHGAPPEKSSWTLAGSPLPWVATDVRKLLRQLLGRGVIDRLRRERRPRVLRMLPAYASGLQHADRRPEVSIPVKQVHAPLLLISGTDDQMWPSSQMAAAIADRRQRADDRLVELVGAGHLVGPPVVPTTVAWSANLVLGGTAEAIASGNARAWAETLDFLSTHLDVKAPA